MSAPRTPLDEQEEEEDDDDGDQKDDTQTNKIKSKIKDSRGPSGRRPGRYLHLTFNPYLGHEARQSRPVSWPRPLADPSRLAGCLAD